MDQDLNRLLRDLRACRLCETDMPNRPNPIFQIDPEAKILVAGQAPGNLADKTGKPFNDPSGVRLRDWMGISEDDFYNPKKTAIIPMGFCFPGYDKNGGDIPPMSRCAKTWHAHLMEQLPNLRVKILIGRYAQTWHLGNRVERTLTATVKRWEDFISDGFITTPHPSWRNNGWIRKNPWFEDTLIPYLRSCVSAHI